ncbi:Ppx/GppA phosphatase family protein [Clostridium tarantellae]|uniref:Ppx/GppA phosphatase N-terminal domain-containing protein n=1 Tax=Clostridium tarantellae TaxID=39493 RepID=A0A6I1MQR9_9CLOT|nr:hypothetical protein [Clostridium tarantellae]MPQ45143.1 hypothetical protein [Clostridium tarantellae]
MENILDERRKEEKNIAILELSTKAVKLLIGDVERIKAQGFNFNLFYRNGILTNTGDGLNDDNYMDLDFFKKQVIPKINKYIEFMKTKNVHVVYCIATAAYRTAKNKNDIIKLIRYECGLEVTILSKRQEAKATLNAINFSSKNLLDEGGDIFLIDLGGGSTELVLFKNGQVKKADSLNFGTLYLRNKLIREFSYDTPIEIALKKIDNYVKAKLWNYRFIYINKGTKCLTVGTTITTVSGKKGNKNHHGIRLTRKQIKSKLIHYDNLIKNKYPTVGHLAKALHINCTCNKCDFKQIMSVDKEITCRLGLNIYSILMDKFKIQNLITSGTGLWYGVYYDRLKQHL